MGKMIFFQKPLDKIFRKVFHRKRKKFFQKSLENTGFSTLSTEFSIGGHGFFGVGMENFLENTALWILPKMLKKGIFFPFVRIKDGNFCHSIFGFFGKMNDFSTCFLATACNDWFFVAKFDFFDGFIHEDSFFDDGHVLQKSRRSTQRSPCASLARR